MWKRLAPSRTKKLSTSWVMILRLTGRGKVARCGLCFFFFLKFKLIMQRGLSLMFAYFIFRTKRALLQFFCNFIPNKHLRVKTRNAFYEKYCRLPPIQDKVILLNEVDKHLPKAVLTQINAYDNEHFIKQNAQILPNFKTTNANLRQNLPNSHKMTGGGI